MAWDFFIMYARTWEVNFPLPHYSFFPFLESPISPLLSFLPTNQTNIILSSCLAFCPPPPQISLILVLRMSSYHRPGGRPSGPCRTWWNSTESIRQICSTRLLAEDSNSLYHRGYPFHSCLSLHTFLLLPAYGAVLQLRLRHLDCLIIMNFILGSSWCFNWCLLDCYVFGM